MAVVVASSSVDAGIGSWDFSTGAEKLRYKTCASPSHCLTAVSRHFLACSQLRDPSASSGHILYWSWSKPQPEVKSFPAEPIKSLAANRAGTFIVGGGTSGDIYFWDVATGKLLKKWHAHYRAVTALVFSEDDSLLVSGSEDGSVRVWSLIRIFDYSASQHGSHMYEFSFTEHSLRVTDIVVGYGGYNAILVSASEDRTCKVRGLLSGRLLRNIVFPSIIDAMALDPAERVFYAGGRDGRIYIAALNAESNPSSSYGKHVIGSLSDQSKGVTCLTYSAEGNILLSGSEDGMIRAWDLATLNIIRMFRHAKGPVNNILVIRDPIAAQGSSKKHGSSLPPPLEKYVRSHDEDDGMIRVTLSGVDNDLLTSECQSSQLFNDQISEFQQLGSGASAEMEVERLKLENRRLTQMVEQWKKMYGNLNEFCVDELLDGQNAGHSKGKVA